MDPTVWGSCLWKTLHIVSLGYSDTPTPEQMINYKTFYENFWKVIPCYACSQNYQRHLIELPLEDGYLSNRKKLFEWTVILHNVVNEELGKKKLTLKEATQYYADMTKKTPKMAEFGYQWILIFIIMVLLGYILFKKK